MCFLKFSGISNALSMYSFSAYTVHKKVKHVNFQSCVISLRLKVDEKYIGKLFYSLS